MGPTLFPSSLPPWAPLRRHRRQQHRRQQERRRRRRPTGQRPAWSCPRRSAAASTVSSLPCTHILPRSGPAPTWLMSLPFSSARSFFRRSSSASMPTDSRTPLMSLAEGEVLPPRRGGGRLRDASFLRCGRLATLDFPLYTELEWARTFVDEFPDRRRGRTRVFNRFNRWTCAEKENFGSVLGCVAERVGKLCYNFGSLLLDISHLCGIVTCLIVIGQADLRR